MAVLSRMIYSGVALIALPCVLALPVPRGYSCDFGVPTPPNLTGPMQTQWCAMMNNEINTLEIKEDAKIIIPNLEPVYKQANIRADPQCALPNMDELTQDSSVLAALTQMKANYPVTGSMDLTNEDIKTVYADHIKAASEKTGVPEDVMAKIILVESKGHPFVYHSLTQFEYVTWGQMVDKNGDLKNRYMPADNIMASAMRLMGDKDAYGCDWMTCFYQHYQDSAAAKS